MKMNEVKIACILDEFTFEGLKYECELIQLDIHLWESQIESIIPDLLLVESACEGKDRQWLGKIINCAMQVEKLLLMCKRKNIPTVFWSKEDPVNFPYFIKTAKLFDYIFTTDLESIPRYKKACKHDNIYVLRHAAQGRIHNPINNNAAKIGKIAFAGAWYGDVFPDRKRDMEILLKPCFKYDLHIYDRNYGKNVGISFKFPKYYERYIKGCLRYEEMIEVYKKYDIALNVNTVKNSSTMHSIRIFELMACGVPIISTYAKSLEELSNIVSLVKNEADTASALEKLLNNEDYRKKLSMFGIREVFKKHTYRCRLEELLKYIGFDYVKEEDGVSVFIFATCENNLNSLLNQYVNQSYEHKEKIIIRSKEEFYTMLLSSTYEYVSIFTDKNVYGNDFLLDIMQGFQYTDAGLIGKNLDCENMYVKYVKNNSFIIRKSLLLNTGIEFNIISEYENFIESLETKGIKIYSVNKLDFNSSDM